MNKVEVRIQETKGGLEDIYPNGGNAITNIVFDDQRLNSLKITRNPVYYSTLVNERNRVYSLYNTDIVDSRDRDGYCAIHLICDKELKIENFRSVLKIILEKYNDFKVNNNILQQNYADILEGIVSSPLNNDIITLPSLGQNKNYYITYKNGLETEIDREFNSLNAYVVPIIYAFNDSNFDNEQAAKYNFRELKNNISNEYKISYDRGFLKKIIVGNLHINSDLFANKTSIRLIVPKSSGSAVAFDGNNKEHYLKATGENVIKKPIIYPKPPTTYGTYYPPSSEPPKRGFAIGTFILGVFLGGILVAGGIWGYNWYNKPNFNQPISNIDSSNPSRSSENNSTTKQESREEVDDIESKYVFDIEKIKVGRITKKSIYFFIKEGFEPLQDFHFNLNDGKTVIFYPTKKDMDENPNGGFKEKPINELPNYFAEEYKIRLDSSDWNKIIEKFREQEQKLIKTTTEPAKSSAPAGNIKPEKKDTKGKHEPKKDDKNEKDTKNGVKPQI